MDNHLSPGDKLPSERYLSEKLNISRSSVREALRAMELIGIISTKRGEGTFLSNMDDHQLFELIGSYLISSDKQINEITEFKKVIEHHLTETGSDNFIMTRVGNLLRHYERAFNEQEDTDV
ncbi:FadR family transcriptional regulator [Macrococcus equipercicus]|uniref:FadR family transcriptional regulator n=2 Tax=Macrococcus equipercicus TaxID=69967 RepID=A0A9Q9BY96_9STAP|nr:FadR family transcriptional regulator [Macrococcus equipercicus]UTH14902.1 FadR family transcriptional regulator [Macrococcus equipercicus]